MKQPSFVRLLGRQICIIRARWPWALNAVVFSAVVTLVFTIWLASLKLPEIGPSAQSSQVLAQDGQVIADLHGEQNRRTIPLRMISPNLQLALLVAEDRDFFHHGGVSLKGVVRAATANLFGGRIRQGGSTITQQYVRNAFPNVGRERTITRKLKEIFWAMQVEQHYTKDQILERYLNTVYFGRGAYGAEAAARTYFKVSASKLTAGESAYLAGIIRAPERFQIDENLQDATRLRNSVIDAMVKYGYLNSRQGESAGREKLKSQFKPGRSIEVDSSRAGYFVEYVRRILKTEFGLTDSQILRGGLQIHTTLDLRMQDAAESAVSSVLNRKDDPEAALVAMGPHGEVRAMVGGRDVDSLSRARGFNFAADINGTGGGRQAGSAFKPFALAAFLSDGKSLQSTFAGDSPIEIGSRRCRNQDGSPWQVTNFEGSSFGNIDVTAATISSVNTVYAEIMDKVVTPSEFIRVAGKAGIEIPRHDAGCALAFGTTDVTPLEMARAYTTFAQRGNRPDPLVVTRIVKPSGKVIAERFPSIQQTIDRNVADSVNYVLERNIKAGTGTGARIGRPAAGKTGTTQNNQNAWFAGYTPELTAVVWMGYAPGPDGKIPEMTGVRGVDVTGGSFPATIWRKFMSRALQGITGTGFHKPVLDGEILNFGSGPKAVVAQAEPSPAPSPLDAVQLAAATSPLPPPDQAQGQPGPTPGQAVGQPAKAPAGSSGQQNPGSPPSQVSNPCFPFCN
jgi:penicillin-binding protein 1A